MRCSALLTLLGSARLALAGYALADDYLANGFFSNWDFFTGDDPTGGYVNYVDQGTAQSNGYVKTNSDGSIYLGVDYTNVASGRGRNSVRLTSQKTYTHYLTVIDLGHMPGGICGTWPAFWSFGSGGSGWPSEGEIDIIEGANNQQQNYMTLHTSPGCEISGASNSLVQSVTQDCDADVDGNEGCSFHDPNSNTYGSQFNAQGGGTYATEWTSQGVNIFFWPAGSAPSDALGDSPNPANWGTPTASWAGSGCDWDQHLLDHNLVFDTTFCGSWAGQAFQSCSAANGGQTCNAFVQNNPSAFQQAYWQIKALKVYQNNGASSPAPQPSTSSAVVPLQSTSAIVPLPSTSAIVPLPSTSATVSLPTPQTTLATSSVSTSAAASVVSPVAQSSNGGVFLPSSPMTTLPTKTTTANQLPPTSISTDSPTTAQPAPAPTTTEFEQENSTGGIFEPGPTQSSVFESEGSGGNVFSPGARKIRSNEHLHQHIHHAVKY